MLGLAKLKSMNRLLLMSPQGLWNRTLGSRWNFVAQGPLREALRRRKRWIVERTFSWIDTNRRNSKNYERLNNTSVAMVHLSAIRIMLNRF
jgi:transposase